MTDEHLKEANKLKGQINALEKKVTLITNRPIAAVVYYGGDALGRDTVGISEELQSKIHALVLEEITSKLSVATTEFKAL